MRLDQGASARANSRADQSERGAIDAATARNLNKWHALPAGALGEFGFPVPVGKSGKSRGEAVSECGASMPDELKNSFAGSAHDT